MSESVREVEVSGENLSKSLSEKGNMWRRKDGAIPSEFRIKPLYNNGLILNIVSKSKGAVRFYLLTILHLERQAALSGIHRNVGLADEST